MVKTNSFIGEARIVTGKDLKKLKAFIKDRKLNDFWDFLNDVEYGFEYVKVVDYEVARGYYFC